MTQSNNRDQHEDRNRTGHHANELKLPSHARKRDAVITRCFWLHNWRQVYSLIFPSAKKRRAGMVIEGAMGFRQACALASRVYPRYNLTNWLII